ncbi:MAG: VaFE repeat-containing surface-anchored protein [Clostridiales bacterium]|nr:VaFE repeat-containing surface-anchored protein [Clostridiales bacterium]
MKFSKMICAFAVASLLMLQNVAPMVPVIADTTETTVETEATEETKHHEETAKPKETTRQTESSETSETTKASEKPVETAVPSETTEPSDETKPSETTESKETTEPSVSAITAETTAPTEKTEPSETTVPSETSESSEPSETTSETTTVETPKIVKAKSADEYIKLVAALPDGDKLIVATKDDLSALKPDAGVYFDGIYTLWFKTGSEYGAAVKYAASHRYGYTEDGVVGLCGTADYSAYAKYAIKTASACSSGKTRIVIIDTGVNGADEAYSVIGSDVKDKNGHGTFMADLIKESTDKAYIISVKAVGDNGKGTVSDVYNALQYAADQKPDIILMAISIKDNPDEYVALKSLIEETASKTTVIASAGNNNADASKYLPAGSDGVITIGAVKNDFYKTATSNYGDAVDYYAVAASTSEASATFVGKYIAKDDSGVVVSYAGSEDGVEYVGDDIFFGIDSDFTDNTKKILGGDDLKMSASVFHQRVLQYAKDICDDNRYQYSLDGGTYNLDCIGFVNKVYYLALGKPAFKSGTSYYEAKYAYKSSSKTYRARIFNGNTAPSCGAWINYAGIRTKPSASSKSKKCTTLSAAAKHINKYAVPGDIIMYGSTTHWVHAAIYAGSANSGKSYYEYAAHNKSLGISRIIKTETTFSAPKSDDSDSRISYVLVVRVTGTSTTGLKFVKKCIGDQDLLGECYSFEGTTYGIYTDEACTTPYSTMPTIEFDEAGETDSMIPTISNYPLTVYLKETKAGPGYLVDDSVYKLNLASTSAGTVTTVEGDGEAKLTLSSGIFTVTLYDIPTFDPLTIRLRKTGVNHASAPMNKATFRIRYYDADYPYDPAVFTPDDFDNNETPEDDFYITISNPDQLRDLSLKDLAGYGSVTVSGDNSSLKAIYDAQLSTMFFPFGTYRIQEATAPDGYYLNDSVYRIKLFMNNDRDADIEMRNEKTGKLLTEFTIDNEPGVDIAVPEINGPAYFSLEKRVTDDSSRAGFTFEIYSGSTLFCTGVSEADGRVRWTYKIADYYSTNKDPEHGALTTLLTNTSAYQIELPSNAQFQIRETFETEGLKSMWKIPEGWSNGGMYYYKNFTSGNMFHATSDSVTNKPAFKSYRLTKELKASDDTLNKAGFVFAVADENDKVYANGVSDENGNVQWTYTSEGALSGIPGASVGGRTEKLLLRPNYADGTPIKYQVRELIPGTLQVRGIPEGWTDGGEYFYKAIDTAEDVIKDSVLNYVPDIRTKATTEVGKTVVYSTQATIKDTVSYRNLVPGKTYTMSGKLIVKSTGKEAKDENGNAIVSSTEFTPETSDGTVEVTFTFNSTLLQGEKLVVFESLTYNKVEYAVHADINDEGQTVYVPKVGTTATIKGKKSIFLASTEVRNITITDKIAYKGLEPGRKYRAEATLYKKNGAQLMRDGKPVTATLEFTPENSSGTVEVKITFSSKGLSEGDKIVVFEKVFDVETNILIGVHEDLKDKNQTVTIHFMPLTGEISPTYVKFGVALASLSALVIALMARRKKKLST